MNRKTETVVGVAAIAVLAAPAVAAMAWYCAFAEGFVLSKIWEWYALPYGLPPIAWRAFAAALMVLANIRRPSPKAEPEDDRPAAVKNAGYVGYLMAPWFMLAIAWIMK